MYPYQPPDSATLNWDPLYNHYMPEQALLYQNMYEDYRNKRSNPRQTEYQVNPDKYGQRFWEEVVRQHRIHRVSGRDSIHFLRIITGQCMPWPDVVRRFPALLETNCALYSRFQSYLGRQLNHIALGEFDSHDIRSVCDKIERDKTATSYSLLCYGMMHVEKWHYLTDDAYYRIEMADWLDLILRRGLLELVEQRIGRHIADFVRLIGNVPPHVPQL